MVKTVNGAAPDENGNVEITIQDSSQNADWENRIGVLETAMEEYINDIDTLVGGGK
jgi:hypothetical protein